MKSVGAQGSLDPSWYNVAQAAQLLGYGETKGWMLIISGDLRSLKDERARRVLPEWVEVYVRLRASRAEDTWGDGDSTSERWRIDGGHERESGTATPSWDGPAVPNPPSRPEITPVGRRDGLGRLGAATAAAVCIRCREPLSYDDGIHIHPTCGA
jgi:hypothetical protein